MQGEIVKNCEQLFNSRQGGSRLLSLRPQT